MKSSNSFHIFALITIVFWSLPNVFTRLAMQHFTAPSLAFLRFLIASLILLVIVLVAHIKPPRLRDLPQFIVGGLVGFGIYMIVFNLGQSMVGSAMGSVIIATVPVVTALLALRFFHERLLAHQWVAIAIEFLGVLVLTLLEGVVALNAGVFWLLFAVVLFAVYNLIQRHITREYTGLQASIYCIFFGTLFLAVFAPQAFGELSTAPPEQWLYLLILAIGPGAISYVAWAVALSKSKNTAQVTNYMFLTPFLAAIVGFLVAGEIPNFATFFGGGIILIGVALFNFGGKLIQRKGEE